MDASQKTTNPAAKPEEKKHTLKQALKDISTAGGITVFVITTLTSFSLPGILSTVLQGDFSLDAEGIVLIWKMILLTAPLTIGIVVVLSPYKGILELAQTLPSMEAGRPVRLR